MRFPPCGFHPVYIEIGNPDSCLRMSRANRDAGLILFAALILDNLV